MPRVDGTFTPTRARHEAANLDAVRALFADLSDDVRDRADAGAGVLLAARWDGLLAEVMLARNLAAATEIGLLTAARFPARRAIRDFDPESMIPWLTANARIGAEHINDTTRQHLEEFDEVDDALGQMMVRAGGIATAMVTLAGNFGARDAAEASGATVKVWQTNSGNPRSAHAALSGATVGIGGTFSNSMKWPGDPRGGAAQVANCQCSLVFA